MKKNLNSRKNRDLKSVNTFKEKIHDLLEENQLNFPNRNQCIVNINRFLKDPEILVEGRKPLDYIHYSKNPQKINKTIHCFLTKFGF